MKIKMLVSIAGASFSLTDGDITEAFSEEEAARLIEKGLAEEVKAPVKKAAKRAPRAKREG